MTATPPKYRQLALSALALRPDLAGQPVPAGILEFWGNELNWPDWIRDGTALGGHGSLPSRIRLADDLVILANFMDRVGPVSLLSALASAPRVPIGPDLMSGIMSAPDGLSAVRLVARLMARNNPHIAFTEVSDVSGLTLSFAVADELGMIGEFIEHAIVLYVISVIRQFLPSLPGQRLAVVSLVRLRGGPVGWGDVVSSVAGDDIQIGASKTSLHLNESALNKANPTHDAAVWRRVRRRLASQSAVTAGNDLLTRVRNDVRAALANDSTVPRMKEVALAHDVSERTLARQLGTAGTPYQQIVDECRIELAADYLLHSPYTVEEIASKLGFSHAASFARAFRRWHGMSPSQWRSSAGKLRQTVREA